MMEAIFGPFLGHFSWISEENIKEMGGGGGWGGGQGGGPPGLRGGAAGLAMGSQWQGGGLQRQGQRLIDWGFFEDAKISEHFCASSKTTQKRKMRFLIGKSTIS